MEECDSSQHRTQHGIRGSDNNGAVINDSHPGAVVFRDNSNKEGILSIFEKGERGVNGPFVLISSKKDMFTGCTETTEHFSAAVRGAGGVESVPKRMMSDFLPAP